MSFDKFERERERERVKRDLTYQSRHNGVSCDTISAPKWWLAKVRVRCCWCCCCCCEDSSSFPFAKSIAGFAFPAPFCFLFKVGIDLKEGDDNEDEDEVVVGNCSSDVGNSALRGTVQSQGTVNDVGKPQNSCGRVAPVLLLVVVVTISFIFVVVVDWLSERLSPIAL